MSDLRTVRLRSGVETVNGITGETGPVFSEYVLLSDYQALQRELAAERERADRNERDAERWRYWRVRPTHWNWFSARSIHTWKTPAQLDADTDAAAEIAGVRGKR